MPGPPPVKSVAGKKGVVTLSNTDIGGLGTAATHAAGDFDAAGLASAALSAATAASAQKAANLSDLANAGTARTNLGLGTAATHAAGDFDAAGAAAAAAAASLPLTGGTVSGGISANNLAIGIGNALHFYALSDGNWGMGLDTGTVTSLHNTYNAVMLNIGGGSNDGFLVGHGGGFAALEVNGSSGTVSANNRLLVNGAADDGTTALQVIGSVSLSGTIKDATPATAIDIANRQLIASDGSTVMADWSNATIGLVMTGSLTLGSGAHLYLDASSSLPADGSGNVTVNATSFTMGHGTIFAIGYSALDTSASPGTYVGQLEFDSSGGANTGHFMGWDGSAWHQLDN